MPNWCGNTLTLTHEDPAQIKRATEAFEKGEFLQTLVPNPAGDWNYDWSVSNWGTKWDVGNKDGINSVTDNELIVYFDSAWSPPTAAYENLVGQGFGVYATYYEPGCAFCGVWDDGSDEYYDLSGMRSDDVRDQIPTELDESFGISDTMEEYERDNEDEVTHWYKEGVEECGLIPHDPPKK